MIPLPNFIIPVVETLNLFMEFLNEEELNQVNNDTNWVVMLSFLNIIISILNVLKAYLDLNLQPDILDAHKMISYLLGYRY